jgi:hypothetical protein
MARSGQAAVTSAQTLLAVILPNDLYQKASTALFTQKRKPPKGGGFL